MRACRSPTENAAENTANARTRPRPRTTAFVSFCSSASKKNLFQRLTAMAEPRFKKRKCDGGGQKPCPRPVSRSRNQARGAGMIETLERALSSDAWLKELCGQRNARLTPSSQGFARQADRPYLYLSCIDLCRRVRHSRSDQIRPKRSSTTRMIRMMPRTPMPPWP